MSRRRTLLAELSSVYLDSETRLMWTRSDNGRNVTWYQAQQHCEDLRLHGYSDWRLPTIEELAQLYDRKSSRIYKIRMPFEPLTACCPWSSTKGGSDSAWYFYFNLGARDRTSLGRSSNRRALCVRGS